jgi:hypothetical protein
MSFTNNLSTDNYTTDKKGWEIIKDYLPTDKKIWCPFYCDGKQKEYFTEMGYDIIHEDEDFFENDKGDIIIDNPPFSKMKEVAERLLLLNKPFILVLPTRYFGIKYFMSKFKNDIQIIIPEFRPTFTMLNEESTGYTPPGGTYYFCWKMNLDKDLIFL